MTAEQFWKDDPQLFASYRTFYINQKEKEIKELDYKCWLQGLYNYEGNNKLFASLKQHISNIVSRMFGKNTDNSKIEPYPKKPFTILEQEKEEKIKEQNKINKYEKFESDLLYFGTMKQRYIDTLKNK